MQILYTIPEVKYDHKSIKYDGTEAHNDIEQSDDADYAETRPGELGPGAGDHLGHGGVQAIALQRGGARSLGHAAYSVEAGVHCDLELSVMWQHLILTKSETSNIC